MLIFVGGMLAIDPQLITEVSYNRDDGSVKIDLSNGKSWELKGHSKQFFNKLVRSINQDLGK